MSDDGVSAEADKFVAIPVADYELAAILHRPRAARRRLGVLIIVGGPQYRVGSHRQFVLTARACANAGYPVLRIDFEGMGDSGGTARSFDNTGRDIRAGIDAFYREVPDLDGVVVYGLCDAAAGALIFSRDDRRLKGLVLANPWVRTAAGEARAYVRHYYWQRLLQGSFWRKLLSGQFHALRSAREFLTTWRSAKQAGEATQTSFVARMLAGLTGFTGPVLILISERDLTAREFQDLCRDSPAWRKAAARSNVRIHLLPDADHTFSSRSSLDAANAATLECLARCLDPVSSRAA